MHESRAAVAIYLILAALVGLGSSGFLLYYSTEAQPRDTHVAITYQRPAMRVLGVEVEEPALAEPGLSAADIAVLFNQYCVRGPSVSELIDWTGGSRADLVAQLEHAQVIVERGNRRYVEGCLPL
ncbi:MAG: hypothetical protein WC505_03970 [Patescibacteria group bacterium]